MKLGLRSVPHLNFMKKRFSHLITFYFISQLILFANHKDEILGNWVTAGGQSRVEIFKKDDLYFGKIVALKEPYYLSTENIGVVGTPRLDSYNPDQSLASRPMIGIELMTNFHFDGEKWVGGRIYDPQNGKNYKCRISLAEDGTLHVRGYVGFSMLGRTTVWEPTEVYLKRELAFLGIENYSYQSSEKASKAKKEVDHIRNTKPD